MFFPFKVARALNHEVQSHSGVIDTAVHVTACVNDTAVLCAAKSDFRFKKTKQKTA
jgi:hypothetical protein